MKPNVVEFLADNWPLALSLLSVAPSCIFLVLLWRQYNK
jgi:hypothetical protein